MCVGPAPGPDPLLEQVRRLLAETPAVIVQAVEVARLCQETRDRLWAEWRLRE